MFLYFYNIYLNIIYPSVYLSIYTYTYTYTYTYMIYMCMCLNIYVCVLCVYM